MLALGLALAVALVAIGVAMFHLYHSPTRLPPISCGEEYVDYVLTDLTLHHSATAHSEPKSPLNASEWHRLERDLYLYSARESAYLFVARKKLNELAINDLVITDVRAGPRPPKTKHKAWESRDGGIWLLREPYYGEVERVVTDVNVLFGTDAADPRPQWTLAKTQLKLKASDNIPAALLTIRHGRRPPGRDNLKPVLRSNSDGRFKIVQISDTHMVAGAGVCKDAINADGKRLPPSEADPLTIDFVGKILDVERPDLVVLTGDNLNGDGAVLDAHSVLLKLVAPMIQRSIPYVSVFGNHDDEGSHNWSRTTQMAFLKTLPFSLCDSGPSDVGGVGNYYVQVLGPAPSDFPMMTLFLLDSHAQVRREGRTEYDWIKQRQINWFTSTSQSLRKEREQITNGLPSHLSLAFIHIPVPEYGSPQLFRVGGHQGEPCESPRFNSHFYDALVDEGVVAVGCGHDHVNDFCGLLPKQQDASSSSHSQVPKPGPWLCYNGGSGFGGYGEWGGRYYHRRTRVWEIDTHTGGLKTWKRVEYATDRVDELELVRYGEVVEPPEFAEGHNSSMVQ